LYQATAVGSSGTATMTEIRKGDRALRGSPALAPNVSRR
jgi:hypothetical protein